MSWNFIHKIETFEIWSMLNFMFLASVLAENNMMHYFLTIPFMCKCARTNIHIHTRARTRRQAGRHARTHTHTDTHTKEKKTGEKRKVNWTEMMRNKELTCQIYGFVRHCCWDVACSCLPWRNSWSSASSEADAPSSRCWGGQYKSVSIQLAVCWEEDSTMCMHLWEAFLHLYCCQI